MVSKEDIEKAREMDLLTYLQSFEPYELVHVSGNTWCTREHDSLKISNGKWHWFSQGIGGRSAIDYLVKVRGYTFPMAVEAVLGRIPVKEAPKAQPAEKEKTRKLKLPELSDSTEVVRNYLIKRGIDPDIIDWCIKRKMILQTKNYDNAVFVGYDSKGNMRYAAIRGTRSRYKGDASGSDKRFSFRISETEKPEVLHLFEAAIDLLSFATLRKMDGYDWKADAMLSLAGVYVNRDGSAPLPKGLERFIKENPQLKEIHLHLDNDEIGRGASIGLCSALQGKYIMVIDPPADGKDVNDELMARLERANRDYER